MIFVTVGTHFQPFDRLVKAADDYASSHKDEIVIVQKGVSTYDCRTAQSFDFCSKEEMSCNMEKADIIVMQGGWGAMQEAIDKGYRVIAVPRIEGLEHIHDQEQVVRKLDSLGCIIGVYDIKDLPSAIEKARNFKFKPLIRGNASIMAETLKSWFGK